MRSHTSAIIPTIIPFKAGAITPNIMSSTTPLMIYHPHRHYGQYSIRYSVHTHTHTHVGTPLSLLYISYNNPVLRQVTAKTTQLKHIRIHSAWLLQKVQSNREWLICAENTLPRVYLFPVCCPQGPKWIPDFNEACQVRAYWHHHPEMG